MKTRQPAPSGSLNPICSDLVEVAANAMQTKVRDAHVIRLNEGPWLDFEATQKLGKKLGFGGYLNLLEWLVEKYGAPFKGVVHWPHGQALRTRQSFEAWIGGPPYERDLYRWPMDDTKHAWPRHYKDIAVQLAWEAWCEAADVSDQEREHKTL